MAAKYTLTPDSPEVPRVPGWYVAYTRRAHKSYAAELGVVEIPECRYWWDEDCGGFGMPDMATRYPSEAKAREVMDARDMSSWVKAYVVLIEAGKPPGFGIPLPTEA